MMAVLYVPVFLAFLAAGMVTGENVALLKMLPMQPWRIAAGKMLWLAFNLCVLGFAGMAAMLQAPRKWDAEHVLGAGGWLLFTLVLASLVFALAAVFRKNAYAIPAAAALLFSLLIKSVMSAARLGPAFLLDPLMIALTALAFLMPLPTAIYFFHRTLENRPLAGRAIALCCLYPAVIGLFFLKEPGWRKAQALSDIWAWRQVSDSKFLLDGRADQPHYLYDLHARRFEEFARLGPGNCIGGTDRLRQSLYFFNVTNWTFRNKQALYTWHRMSLADNTVEKLGQFPEWSLIRGDVILWRTGRTGAQGFGFASLKTGRTFETPEDAALFTVTTTAGVLFETREGMEKIWRFADFARAESREAFRGDYEAQWWWRQDACAYLMKGNLLFQWNPATGVLREIGEYRLKEEISGSELLLAKGGHGMTTLVLWRDGVVVAQRAFPFRDVHRPMEWSEPPADRQNRLVMECINTWLPKSASQVKFGILTIRESSLDWTPLPDHLLAARMLPGGGGVLLCFGRWPESWFGISGWTVPKVCLYDPSAGSVRRLS
jgi:hypothetical protein